MGQPRPGVAVRRVLLLEDDPGMTALVEEALGGAGFSITVLRDALQLEAALAAVDHHLVISDLQMPGRSGLEVLRYLRREKPELARRFILMTGSPADADRAAAELVSIPVLHKPFSLVRLLELVRKMIQKPN